MPGPLIPALVAGGASLAGGIVNSAVNLKSARDQMRFQERMSSTAHQREVNDLVKAGLNPLLSLKSGGASSPPGARADVDVGADKAVSSALQARQLSLQQQQVESQISLQSAQANQANSAAALSQAQAKQVTETLPVSLDKLKAEISSVLAGTAVSQAQVPEIAQRIKESLERIKLLEQQTDTEKVRMQKEKALRTLWKALGDVLENVDSATRKNILPQLKEKITPYLPWLPYGSIFMKGGEE